MQELLTGVNWMAVIVGAIVAYGLGYFWFGDKMFGRKWMSGTGVKKSDPTSQKAMFAQALGTFLMSWVVGVTAVNNQLWLIMLIALTYAVLIEANGYFVKKSKYAIYTEAGYVLAMVAIMIFVQGIF